MAGFTLSSAPAEAQEPADPLRKHTTNKMLIGAQARAALPRTQRALEIITTTADPQELKAALDHAEAAYRYLRTAQMNTENVIKVSKFPDPILALQKDQMWTVRGHLLRCIQNASYVAAAQPRKVAECTENLATAVAKLEALLATMP